MGASSTVPNGAIQPWSTWGEFNRIQFVVAQLLSRIQTLTLVKVISCTNAGGVSPVGSVNVQPCVNQTDSAGNPQPHGIIYNVPYLRLFGGNAGNAVILDPEPGDIGLCAFASRDVSQVVSTQAPANPGSNRSYDFSDALYIGGMLNGGVPAQYVQFQDAGITIVSPVAITLQAPTINLKGNVAQINGTITAQSDVQAGPNNISLVNHTHTSEDAGDPTSPPLP